MCPTIRKLSLASYHKLLYSRTGFEVQLQGGPKNRPGDDCHLPLKASALQLILGRKQKFKMHDDCSSAPCSCILARSSHFPPAPGKPSNPLLGTGQGTTEVTRHYTLIHGKTIRPITLTPLKTISRCRPTNIQPFNAPLARLIRPHPAPKFFAIVEQCLSPYHPPP